MSKPNSIYKTVGAMEPMMPNHGVGECAELTSKILKASGVLEARLPSKILRREIARLVRRMNSYYSNLIEGHETLPRDIEAAEKKIMVSGDEEKKRSIRMGVAHMEVEELVGDRLMSNNLPSPYSSEFICFLHKEFYGLFPEDWPAKERSITAFCRKPI